MPPNFEEYTPTHQDDVDNSCVNITRHVARLRLTHLFGIFTLYTAGESRGTNVDYNQPAPSSDIESYLSSITSSLSNIESTLNSINSNLSNINSSLNSIESDTQSSKSYLYDIKSELWDIENDVDDVESYLSSIESNTD